MMMEDYDRTVRKLTQRSPRSVVAIPCGILACIVTFLFMHDALRSNRTVASVSDAIVDQLMGAISQHVAVHTESVELRAIAPAHAFRSLHLEGGAFPLDGLVAKTMPYNFTMIDYQESVADDDRWMRNMLLESTTPPSLVVDVGSGVGSFSLFAASEGFRVRAVEMNPRCAEKTVVQHHLLVSDVVSHR